MRRYKDVYNIRGSITEMDKLNKPNTRRAISVVEPRGGTSEITAAPATLSVADLLTEKAASERSGFSVPTLRIWRSYGVGPKYLRVGRAIFYVRPDLDLFLRTTKSKPRLRTRANAEDRDA